MLVVLTCRSSTPWFRTTSARLKRHVSRCSRRRNQRSRTWHWPSSRRSCARLGRCERGVCPGVRAARVWCPRGNSRVRRARGTRRGYESLAALKPLACLVRQRAEKQRRARHGDHADLAQHAQSCRKSPSAPPFCRPRNGRPRCLRYEPSWGRPEPHHFTAVRPGHGYPCRDLVAIGYQIVNAELIVREGSAPGQIVGKRGRIAARVCDTGAVAGAVVGEGRDSTSRVRDLHELVGIERVGGLVVVLIVALSRRPAASYVYPWTP